VLCTNLSVDMLNCLWHLCRQMSFSVCRCWNTCSENVDIYIFNIRIVSIHVRSFDILTSVFTFDVETCFRIFRALSFECFKLAASFSV